MSSLWLRGLGLIDEDTFSPRDQWARDEHEVVMEKARKAADYWEVRKMQVKIHDKRTILEFAQK